MFYFLWVFPLWFLFYPGYWTTKANEIVTCHFVLDTCNWSQSKCSRWIGASIKNIVAESWIWQVWNDVERWFKQGFKPVGMRNIGWDSQELLYQWEVLLLTQEKGEFWDFPLLEHSAADFHWLEREGSCNRREEKGKHTLLSFKAQGLLKVQTELVCLTHNK